MCEGSHAHKLTRDKPNTCSSSYDTCNFSILMFQLDINWLLRKVTNYTGYIALEDNEFPDKISLIRQTQDI